MPRQLIYQGRPTAKLTLFNLWDAGYDDTNKSLARDLGISVSTVRSYRVEWKARRGRGVKTLFVIAKIDPNLLPLATKKGIVWRIPLKEKLKCNSCPCARECRWWVQRGGYLGCEEVFEEELWEPRQK